MLANGFHIHHVDGDHSNNNPTNLVLMEGVDHTLLHGHDIRLGAKDSLRQISDRARYDRAKRPLKRLGSATPLTGSKCSLLTSEKQSRNAWVRPGTSSSIGRGRTF